MAGATRYLSLILPEEPAHSRRASGVQAHVRAEGKRLLSRAAPEPQGLDPSGWAKTGGTSPKPRLGSGDPAVWKKSGPVLPRRAGEGGYKRFSAYCKRIVRRLRGWRSAGSRRLHGPPPIPERWWPAPGFARRQPTILL